MKVRSAAGRSFTGTKPARQWIARATDGHDVLQRLREQRVEIALAIRHRSQPELPLAAALGVDAEHGEVVALDLGAQRAMRGVV